MTRYLTTTFSPTMIGSSNLTFDGLEVTKTHMEYLLTHVEWESRVGHEVTAKVLTVLLEREVKFNRRNIQAYRGDQILAIIPQFRATEAREFTKEEVEKVGIRYFLLNVY